MHVDVLHPTGKLMSALSTTLNNEYVAALCYYVLKREWTIPSWINVNDMIMKSMVPAFRNSSHIVYMA